VGTSILIRIFILKLDAYNNGDSCINSKRIYVNYDFSWNCPKCKEDIISNFNTVPLISYGSYCHVYVCELCDFESDEKMYTLNAVGINFVDITLNLNYDLKIL
jgi:hypothetical protein